jgi:ACR3 family arsenite efflux pump ArsB
VLFIFMVLGMLGKVAFDALGIKAVRLGWKARAKACALPLVVSPITFLGILQLSNTSAPATGIGFLAIACTAFQSGFFWHTVFDGLSAGPQNPGAAGRVRTRAAATRTA